MEVNSLADLVREALFILMKISLPILLLSLSIGLIISLFQALTQIQENSLTFVPKFIVILCSLLFFTGYIIDQMKMLWEHIGDYIVKINQI